MKMEAPSNGLLTGSVTEACMKIRLSLIIIVCDLQR